MTRRFLFVRNPLPCFDERDRRFLTGLQFHEKYRKRKRVVSISKSEVVMKPLFIGIVLSVVLQSYVSAGDPPPLSSLIPVSGEQEITDYSATLDLIYPSMSDKEIAEQIVGTRQRVEESVRVFIEKGRSGYRLPPKPIAISWDLTGITLAEAPPGNIRFNQIYMLLNPDIYIRSIAPHEVAHQLFFEIYGIDTWCWHRNADHDYRWATIMRALVGFVDETYPHAVRIVQKTQ